jgi:hypothetical protein
VAAVAEGVSALFDCAELFLCLVALRRVREHQSRFGQAGRKASPTAGVIDSQSVKTTESGGPRGLDAGKKIKGRKRHIVTDTQGNLVGLVVNEADVQDRDGASRVLAFDPFALSVVAPDAVLPR